MIKHIPYTELGHADHGWLNARHHFSFASYQNPERMRFGALRVINDDVIAAGTGFDTHPHKDMEIITYVRTGAISHKDSNGNEGRTVAGDVQVMSAGTGISHSEFNLESEDTTLFQIWIEPRENNLEPAWDAREFPKVESSESLSLLVSGDGSAPLQIYQDAEVYAGKLKAGAMLDHPIQRQAYVVVSEGELEIEGVRLQRGDGLEVTDTTSVSIQTISDCELLVLDVPEQAQSSN